VSEIVYTCKELAEMLKIKERTVREWCRTGHIDSIKIGRDYRIKKETVDMLLGGRVEG
jgi:excisionase family DNA binding protein